MSRGGFVQSDRAADVEHTRDDVAKASLEALAAEENVETLVRSLKEARERLHWSRTNLLAATLVYRRSLQRFKGA